VVIPAALARRRTMAQAEPLAVELRLAATIGAHLDGLEEGHPPGLGQPGTIDVWVDANLPTGVSGRTYL